VKAALAPGGDAMAVRYRTEVPKREDVRRPLAWLIHPDDHIQIGMVTSERPD
jgi:hypothetical protein